MIEKKRPESPFLPQSATPNPAGGSASRPPLRIAIASSGLGHIRRGVESWAEDIALALHRRGMDVTLFQGGGQPTESWRRALPCLRRFESPGARVLAITRRLSGWRLGIGSAYGIEQTTFAFSLWRAVRSTYDILHVQDPRLALLMDRLNRMGLSKPKVILGHGTEESNEELQPYSCIEHMTPGYQEEYEPYRPPRQLTFAIPFFIDIERFRPGDRHAARQVFGLPQDSLIILCAAAVKKHHKRCDYLIREFAAFREQFDRPMTLVIAGARELETPEVVALGKSLLGDSVVFLEAIDRDKLAVLYQAADIFALASLHEVFGIVFLEAMASGIPVSCNNTSTLRWVVGPAGMLEDISQPGGFVRQWARLLDPGVRMDLSRKARAYVEANFCESEILKQIVEMYYTVINS